MLEAAPPAPAVAAAARSNHPSSVHLLRIVFLGDHDVVTLTTLAWLGVRLLEPLRSLSAASVWGWGAAASRSVGILLLFSRRLLNLNLSINQLAGWLHCWPSSSSLHRSAFSGSPSRRLSSTGGTSTLLLRSLLMACAWRRHADFRWRKGTPQDRPAVQGQGVVNVKARFLRGASFLVLPQCRSSHLWHASSGSSIIFGSRFRLAWLWLFPARPGAAAAPVRPNRCGHGMAWHAWALTTRLVLFCGR